MGDIFRLADHGKTFSTRPRGRELRDQVPCHGEAVVLDLAGVHSMSFSFADEFVARLVERAAAAPAPHPITIIDPAPAVSRVLNRAVGKRGLTVEIRTAAPGAA